MAGIFESRELRGSSLQGESYIKQAPSYGDIGGKVLKSAAMINAGVQSHIAQKEISETQENFLKALDTDKQLKAEKAALTEGLSGYDHGDPAGKASYLQAKSKIAALQSAIDSGRTDPVAALSKIDSIKKKYMARSPGFASHISGLSGESSTQFNVEIRQRIKEINDKRDAMNKLDLDPDDPLDVQYFSRINEVANNVKHQQDIEWLENSEARELAKLSGMQEDIEFIQDAPSRALSTRVEDLKKNEYLNAKKIMQNSNIIVKNSIGLEMNKLDKDIQALGGRQALTGQQIAEFTGELQQFLGGGSDAVVNQIIGSLGYNPTDLSKEDRSLLASMVSGIAQNKINWLSNKTAAVETEHQLNMWDDKVLLRIQRDHPEIASQIAIASIVPESILISKGFDESLATALTYMARAEYGMEDSRKLFLSRLGMLSDGTPKSIQDAYAATSESNLSETIERIREGTNSKGQFTIETDGVLNILRTMAQHPEEFTPSLFKAKTRWLMSKDVMDELERLDPAKRKEMARAASNALNSYVRQNTIPQIYKEMNRRVYTDFNAKATIADLVLPTIDEYGVLRFEPKVGFTSENDQRSAAKFAETMSRRFSKFSSEVIDIAESVVPGMDEKKAQEYGSLLFQEILGGKKEVTEPDWRFTKDQIEREVFNIGTDLGLTTGGVLNAPMRSIKRRILVEELGSEKLRDSLSRELDPKTLSEIAEERLSRRPVEGGDNAQQD